MNWQENTEQLIISEAMHLDPTRDAFPPVRNAALDKAKAELTNLLSGDETAIITALTKGVKGELVKAKEKLEQGKTRIETLSFGERMWPSGPVELKLTAEIKRRGLWWNKRARALLKNEGIENLFNDSAEVCLALGMGQWLDTGHFIVEPRFVGNSLEPAKKEGIDLYQEFGLKPENFVFFPHMKHKPGFYNQTYRHLLFGEHVTLDTFLQSYRLIYELMELNHQDVLLIPAAWFYDPDLSKVAPNFDWVAQSAEKIVLLGEAEKLDHTQLDFALQSPVRKQLYKEGRYKPKVAAAFTSKKFLKQLLAK